MHATDEGAPQGGPLSPLLSNIVLDELDRELARRGHRFVRYADDCNIYVRSRRAAERTMSSVTRFVERRLRLKVNREKSAVDHPSRRKFPGFSFGHQLSAKRRIAPASRERFKARIRELTRRSRGGSLEEIIGRLNSYVRGWLGYFGFCETPTVLRELEGWLHRRLRALSWHRWQRPRTRYRELRRLGLSTPHARKAAFSSRGCWYLSQLPSLNKAIPRRFWNSQGLIHLEVKPS